MLTGKTFRLRSETLGVESPGQKIQHTVMIPADSVVYVQRGTRPDDPRMLDLRWHRRMIMIFSEDLRSRGEEVNEGTA
jgi:hypothetical protein